MRMHKDETLSKASAEIDANIKIIVGDCDCFNVIKKNKKT